MLVWSIPPPSKNDNLGRSWDFGFELVWSTPSPFPGVSGSSYVETNFCIPRGYHRVFNVSVKENSSNFAEEITAFLFIR